MREDAPATVREYVEKSAETASSVAETRFVSLDCETTGLDPKTARVIEIGAVGVRDGQILLDDVFETLVWTAYNTSSVTVHGITREESRAGLTEEEALEALLAYVGDSVIVGHHIGYDILTINQALERHWGVTLHNRSLDTMGLALLLERDGAFEGQEPLRSFSLDALCERFGVKPYDRHTAAGDAFLTAQVFLRLLRLGRKFGRETLDALLEPWSE